MVIIVWFGLTFEPSFFDIRALHPLILKICFAYAAPPTIADSLEIILTVILFFGSNALVMSPLYLQLETVITAF